MDTVFVKNLRFKTIIGCWDWERQMPQQVNIDLEMGWDFSAAVSSNELGDALNYKAVASRVRDVVKAEEFELVEVAADSIANLVMKEFSVPWIKVTFSKPHAVTGSEAVGVIVERGSRA